jgi:GTP cyclohydrolase I
LPFLFDLAPKRVVKAFKEYFKGYKEDPDKILDKTFGDVEGYDDMVVQKNVLRLLQKPL